MIPYHKFTLTNSDLFLYRMYTKIFTDISVCVFGWATEDLLLELLWTVISCILSAYNKRYDAAADRDINVCETCDALSMTTNVSWNLRHDYVALSHVEAAFKLQQYNVIYFKILISTSWNMLCSRLNHDRLLFTPIIGLHFMINHV